MPGDPRFEGLRAAAEEGRGREAPLEGLPPRVFKPALTGRDAPPPPKSALAPLLLLPPAALILSASREQ